MIQNLEDLLVRHVSAGLRQAAQSSGTVLLYGAGQHTWWLLRAPVSLSSCPIAAVIDDHATPDSAIGNYPILSPEKACEKFGQRVTVILSTDTWQSQLAERARICFGPDVRIIDLYRGLPPGPYRRDSERVVLQAGEALTRPSARCIARSAAALSGYLHAHRLHRVFLLGQPWQTQAAADALAPQNIKVVSHAGGADAAIVCADELEPAGPSPEPPRPEGLRGPVLTLRTGQRPWFDRTPRPPAGSCPSNDKVRIVIRHDHNLGDVILSQGTLPRRIKTELYPNAHITFITSRLNWRRPGSDSTGWSLDVLKHNPWIDTVLDPDHFGTGSWTQGADLSYLIMGSGQVYDHVFDFHAMNVELPPGRTDAQIYLAPHDTALAERLLGRQKRPFIGVNMALAADRFRGWSAEKTAQLCDVIENKMGGTVVWLGWTDFGRFKRLCDGDRPLSVREQAAVMATCDIHVTCQGGGANMSAAVGCQTLSLSGLHPAHREGVAYFGNPYIEDPSRRHVELYRYRGQTRVLNYSRQPSVPWSLSDSRLESPAELAEYMVELWQTRTPLDKLNAEQEHWWRVRSLSLADVTDTLAAMLEARRTGQSVPGV